MPGPRPALRTPRRSRCGPTYRWLTATGSGSANVEREVITLVGRTPGSVTLLHRDAEGLPHLVSGDSPFPDRPGQTTSPENLANLMDDQEAKVVGSLPDDTRFSSGHGDDSTLGAERPSLAEWRAGSW